MGGLLEPSPLTASKPDSNLRAILLGVALVVVVVGIIALLLRASPKGPAAPHAYASNLKLADLKMSAAENFVGASVTYIDGTISNAGDKTVTHAMVHVIFRDSMNQIVQAEDVAVHVLRSGGPYPEAVDLSVSPLAAGQGQPFRLTFEHISTDWNQAYPELQITEVTVR